MEASQKIKKWIIVWCSNSTSGFYPKKTKIITQKDMCTHVQGSIIYNIENMKSTSVSINGWMDKENVIHTHTHTHTHTGILFDHKKEEKLAICNNMDRSWGHYTMWTKSNKDRYLMLSLYKESKNKPRST